MKIKSIELTINPFSNKIEIFTGINNITLDRIDVYDDEPCYRWFDDILEKIGISVNGLYYLKLYSTMFTKEIIESTISTQDYCEKVYYEPFNVSLSTKERLVLLKEICDTNNINYKIDTKLISVYITDSNQHSKIISSLVNQYGFSMDNSDSTILSDWYPLIKMKMTILDYSKNTFDRDSSYARYIIVNTLDEAEEILDEINNNENPVVFLVKEILEQTKNVRNSIIYSIKNTELVDSILNFFEFIWLNNELIKIKNKIINLLKSTHNFSNNTLQMIESLTNIEPIIKINQYNDIFVGDELELGYEVFPVGEIALPQLHYKVVNEKYAIVNGNKLTALREGVVNIELYKYESNLPVDTVNVRIRERNLVKQININVKRKSYLVGDKIQIKYNLYPKDAINKDNIRFETTNAMVASVDYLGVITCNGTGKCNISIIVDKVSARMEIYVKSMVDSIVFEDTKIVMLEDEKRLMDVRFLPMESINPGVYCLNNANNNGLYTDIALIINENRAKLQLIAKVKGVYEVKVATRDNYVENILEVKILSKYFIIRFIDEIIKPFIRRIFGLI